MCVAPRNFQSFPGLFLCASLLSQRAFRRDDICVLSAFFCFTLEATFWGGGGGNLRHLFFSLKCDFIFFPANRKIMFSETRVVDFTAFLKHKVYFTDATASPLFPGPALVHTFFHVQVHGVPRRCSRAVSPGICMGTRLLPEGRGQG